MDLAPIGRSGVGAGVDVPVRRRSARGAGLAVLMVALLAGCAGPMASPSAPVPVASPSAAASPTPGSTQTLPPLDPSALHGIWEGILGEGEYAYPVTLRVYPCDGALCAVSEYGRPDDASSVLCAAELDIADPADGAFEATERMTYQPWECLATTLVLRPTADGVLEVEQYGDRSQRPLASATFRRTAPGAAPTPVPLPAAVDGLGTPVSSIDLGGQTTQYTAEGFGSLWLPNVQGSVLRVDLETGQLTGSVAIGDPAKVDDLHSDPHAVAPDANGIWVSSVADRELAFIDPATMAVTRHIPLPVQPYALAIEGPRAYVTSFVGDALLTVDLVGGTVLATTEVAKPTGVAVGAGKVWVVAHRENVVVAVNPKSAEVVDRIELGLPKPSDLCGACVENIVFADGSLWTADNEARSVTRIDARTGTVAEHIQLPLRVWAVAAGGGRVWAGQFDGGRSPDDWQVAAIDPGPNTATSHSLPAFGVAWAGDALWTVVPDRRTDILTKVDVEG